VKLGLVLFLVPSIFIITAGVVLQEPEAVILGAMIALGLTVTFTLVLRGGPPPIRVRVEGDRLVVAARRSREVPLTDLAPRVDSAGQLALDTAGDVRLPVSTYRDKDVLALRALLAELTGSDYGAPWVRARRLARAHRKPFAPFVTPLPRQGLPLLAAFMTAIGCLPAAFGVGIDVLGMIGGVAIGLLVSTGIIARAIHQRRGMFAKLSIDDGGLTVVFRRGRTETIPFGELNVEVSAEDVPRLHIHSIDVAVCSSMLCGDEEWKRLLSTLSTALGYDITRPREEAMRLAAQEGLRSEPLAPRNGAPTRSTAWTSRTALSS